MMINPPYSKVQDKNHNKLKKLKLTPPINLNNWKIF